MSMTRKMLGSQVVRLGSRRWRSVKALACAIFAFLALTFLATGVQATIIFDNFDVGGGFHGQDNAVAAAAYSILPPLKVPLGQRQNSPSPGVISISAQSQYRFLFRVVVLITPFRYF